MTISIEEARKILGTEQVNYTDEELCEIINIFTVLSDLAIDSFLTKRRLKQEEK